MIGTILYVFGSNERLSKPTKEMYMPVRPIPKGDIIFVVCANWIINRNWHTKVLDTRKVLQLKLLRREIINLLLTLVCRQEERYLQTFSF